LVIKLEYQKDIFLRKVLSIFSFKNWVTDLYNLRTNLEKSHPMNYISKILLNSLYGRKGMGELSGRSEIVSKKEFNSFT